MLKRALQKRKLGSLLSLAARASRFLSKIAGEKLLEGLKIRCINNEQLSETSRKYMLTGSARSKRQKELIETYRNIQEKIIQNIRPGWKVGHVTTAFTEAFAAKGFGDNWISGPVHGVGLEFEEWPHPSHYFGHAQLEIGENWTLAIGHSILPVKRVGGVKIEDTISVTSTGVESLNHTVIIE
jgi:Xaa-Pro aminopeptidase